MYRLRSRPPLEILIVLWASLTVFAQNSNTGPASPKQAQPTVVRLGVAMVQNQSRRIVSPKWERDQLVRDLNALRKGKKGEVQIEAVALEASTRDDALLEAAKKNCRFVVVTVLLDVTEGRGVSLGVDGVHVTPTIMGNADPGHTVAMDFVVLEEGRHSPVAEGRSIAPDSVTTQTDESAVDEAARVTALRVASETRKPRPPVVLPE